jgi:hypothetical protein
VKTKYQSKDKAISDIVIEDKDKAMLSAIKAIKDSTKTMPSKTKTAIKDSYQRQRQRYQHLHKDKDSIEDKDS